MKWNLNWFSDETEFEINVKFSFKLIFKFKLNMKMKFTFEIRIVHKNSLALMGHHSLCDHCDWSLKNKKNLNFVIYIYLNRKCLKAISSVKTKKISKPFQRKNINLLYSFWIYIPVLVISGKHLCRSLNFN